MTDIFTEIQQAKGRYYRLVLLVSTSPSALSAQMRTLHRRHDWPMINLGAALSPHLLEFPSHQRALKLDSA